MANTLDVARCARFFVAPRPFLFLVFIVDLLLRLSMFQKQKKNFRLENTTK